MNIEMQYLFVKLCTASLQTRSGMARGRERAGDWRSRRSDCGGSIDSDDVLGLPQKPEIRRHILARQSGVVNPA
jgi:hypothetical protein